PSPKAWKPHSSSRPSRPWDVTRGRGFCARRPWRATRPPISCAVSDPAAVLGGRAGAQAPLPFGGREAGRVAGAALGNDNRHLQALDEKMPHAMRAAFFFTAPRQVRSSGRVSTWISASLTTG